MVPPAIEKTFMRKIFYDLLKGMENSYIAVNTSYVYIYLMKILKKQRFFYVFRGLW